MVPGTEMDPNRTRGSQPSLKSLHHMGAMAGLHEACIWSGLSQPRVLQKDRLLYGKKLTTTRSTDK